jgi:hypothetical protein
MQAVRIVRWLESVSGLAAGVFGLFSVRDQVLALRELPNHVPFVVSATFGVAEAFGIGVLIATVVMLTVGVAGALLDGWIGGISLTVVAMIVLGMPFGRAILLPAAFLFLLAGAFSMLAERLALTPPPAR